LLASVDQGGDLGALVPVRQAAPLQFRSNTGVFGDGSRWASLAFLGPVLGFFGAGQLPRPQHIGEAVAAADGLTMRTAHVLSADHRAGVTALNDVRLPARLTGLKPWHWRSTVPLAESRCAGACDRGLSFLDYGYVVEVQLIKNNESGTPGIVGVQLFRDEP
jgi:hypothetical protein